VQFGRLWTADLSTNPMRRLQWESTCQGAVRNRIKLGNTRKEEALMDYVFFGNLQQEFSAPDKGILSRVLHKDADVNITAFSFSSGEELSLHSAPTPAILYFLEGEAVVQLGAEKMLAQPGTFVYMPPMLPHAIEVKSPVKMLLIQVRRETSGAHS
jgi:quercetin dioxygenase-like cupin family protein